MCFNYQKIVVFESDVVNSLEQGQDDLRLWEIEQSDGHQISHVKGGLRENIAYWWDVLQAPAPVIDLIESRYNLPFIMKPPICRKTNQSSVL